MRAEPKLRTSQRILGSNRLPDISPARMRLVATIPMGMFTWESDGERLGIRLRRCLDINRPLEAPVQPSSTIDMLTPAQTCSQMSLDEQGVLDLVNTGRLAAYNLGGNIRFRASDVAACARRLVAA